MNFLANWLLSLLFVHATRMVAPLDDRENISAAFDAIRQSRLSLAEGRVTLQSRMSKRVGHTLRQTARTDYICYFRGTELRMDRTIYRIGSTGAEGVVLQETTIANANGEYLHSESPPDGSDVVASILGPSAEDSLRRQRRSQVWDIRLLGLCNEPFPIHHSCGRLEEALSLDSAIEVSIDQTSGHFQIRFANRLDQFELDRGESGLPLSISTIVAGKVASRLLVTPQKAKHPRNALLWFPSRVTCTQFDQEGNATLENDVVVTDVDFTTPLSSGTFTLAGLSLRPGHVVDVVPPISERAMQWDGERLIAIQVPQDLALATSPQRRLPWAVLLCAAVCSGIGVWLLYTRNRESA